MSKITQGKPLVLPDWMTKGGKATVKVMEMPIEDTERRYLIEPEGLVKQVWTAHYKYGQADVYYLKELLQEYLQALLRDTYAATKLPVPGITGVDLVWCDLLPVQKGGSS
jgi:hypothetical protein